MFSFRELVESMEKKTCESVKKKSASTQPQQKIISPHAAHKDCEITPRSQTSQCRAEATTETEDEWKRREGLWDCNESVKDQEQERKGIWWRDEESGTMRTNGRYENSKMEIEATQIMRKDIGQTLALKRKHLNMTSGHSNCSIDNIYDPLQRNCCTLSGKPSPLIDLAHREEALRKRNVEFSNPNVHTLKQRRVCSNRGSECEQEHNSDQDSLAYSFRGPSEDKNGVPVKRRYLVGSKRKVHGIDNQYKTRERVSLPEEEGYSFHFLDETRSDCQRFGDGSLRKVTDLKGSSDTLEEFASQEFCFHSTHNSRQYVDMWHRETSGKETFTLAKRLGRHTTQAEGPRDCNLNCPLMTDPLNNNTSGATPLIGDSQQINSANYKNAACCDFRTKDKVTVEHEWTPQSLTDREELQKSKNSVHVLSTGSPKLSKKESLRGTQASERGNSGIPFKHTTLSLSKKLDNASYNKQLHETDFETDKSSQNDKARNTRGYRRNETQIGFPDTQNKDEDTRGNKELRSASPFPLGFRCPQCSCWWRDEASLGRHLRQHAPARPFACPDCPSRFNQLVHLQIHRRTHTGEKPFRCATCSASFSRKDRLRSHERRHSGEHPYTCPYCTLSFRDAASLRSHVPTHAHRPPFTCRVCRSTFAHLSTFTSHWRLHK